MIGTALGAAVALAIDHPAPLVETISRFVDQRIRVVSVSVESILTRDTVQRALESCRKGKRDFADSLIGHVNLARACRHTATFDKALTATPGFRLL